MQPFWKQVYVISIIIVFMMVGLPHIGWPDTVLQDFEKARDANMWEVDRGHSLEVDREVVITGSGSLRIPMDTHMYSTLLPRNWTGHHGLAFDIHNPFDTPISIKMVLSDDGWLDRKSHWNQHHRFLLASPGTSTITVPFASIYRGTEAQRFLDLKTPFNLASVMRIDMEFKGQRGHALLDNLRLVSGGPTVQLVAPVAPALVQPSVPVAAPPAPRVLAGPKILNGFESVRDVVTWEKREGWFEPEQSKKHVTEGEYSYKLAPSTLLVNMRPQRNWTGYEMLELDAFVEGETVMTLELMVGDDAWTGDQHYYSRHNSSHRLVPGPNTISIPLADLYRGEAQRRNTRIARNIDLDRIVQMNVRIHGKKGFLYLDQLRLSGTAPTRPAYQAQARAPSPVVPMPYQPPVSRVASVTPVQPVVGGGNGVKMLSDFETLREVLSWEKREGWFEPVAVKQHVTHGEKALKVGNETLMVNMSLPRNWLGYTNLELDAFVEGKRAMNLEIMIGDMAWNQDQNYYSRHNSTHRLLPGENTIVIALKDLYRGEVQRKNTRIPRNIDLDAITQVNLRLAGSSGYAYMDGFRLTGGPDHPPQTSVPAARRPSVTRVVPQPTLPQAPPPPAGKTPAPEVPAPAEKKKIRIQGDKTWNGFENLRDLASWDVRYGPAPEMVKSHVTEGEQSLLCAPETLLSTYHVPRSWRGYESVAFDVFLEGNEVIKVEVMLGDDAWTQKQTYWNRHNNIFSLVPGQNTISIPVEGLFRGEPASRNRDIKGNLDPEKMTQMNIWFKAGQGKLYLDNCRLLGYEEGDLFAHTGAGGAGGQAAHDVLFDFETLRDVGAWEVHRGINAERVKKHAVRGAYSLQVDSGTLIASSRFPTDWSAYDALEFSAHLEGEEVVKLEVMVGDEAWTKKQTYWNRYNQVYPLVPGENRISIPVQGLFRGEPQSRNRDIQRNIDSDAIVQVNLGFIGGKGTVYFDDIALTRAGDQTARVYAFDFGPADQAVWPGFEAVSWNTVYYEEAGFGLEQAQGRPKYAGDVTFPTRMLQDYVHIDRGDFRVDVPNGEYQVYVYFEDAGYWGGEYAQFTYRSIAAEGDEKILEDRKQRGPHWDAQYLFEDMEPSMEGLPIAPYLKALYAPKTFTVTVKDGQLNILPWSDAPWSTRISAIVAHAKGDESGEKWVQSLWDKNMKELVSRAAWIKPRQRPLPGSMGELGIFVPNLGEDVLLSSRPALVSGEPVIAREGSRGQTLLYSFGLLAADDRDDLNIHLGPIQHATGQPLEWNVALSRVRHLAKRGYEDLSYRIRPWYILPEPEKTTLKQGVARQFVVEVDLPENATPGGFSQMIEIRSGDRVLRTLRLEGTVHHWRLPGPDLPVSFFGMHPEDYALFRRMGATAISGGGGVHITGWESKIPRLDFKAADAIFDKARAAGLSATSMGYGGPASLVGMHPEKVEAFFKHQGQQAGLPAEEAAQKVFAAIQQHAENKDWPNYTINLVDEPRTHEQIQRLKASAAFLHRAVPSIPTIGYMAYTDLEPSGALHGIYQHLQGIVTKNYSEALMKNAAAQDKSIYLYSLGRKRYVFGPLLWKHRKNGAAGYIQWHASLVHGYQFFDLDGREPDMGLVVRRSDGVYPTMDLLRIREGVYDYGYLLLLEEALAKSDEPALEAARAWLGEQYQRIDTQSRNPPPGFNPDAFRSACLDWIKALLPAAD